MERLTKQLLLRDVNGKKVGHLSANGFEYFCETVSQQKIVNRLGAFEDVMEKYGLNIISDIEDVFLKFKRTNQENQALKDRWEKLKEILIKSRDINKDNINCTTLIGVLGAEAFSELLLRQMEELEKGGK